MILHKSNSKQHQRDAECHNCIFRQKIKIIHSYILSLDRYHHQNFLLHNRKIFFTPVSPRFDHFKSKLLLIIEKIYNGATVIKMINKKDNILKIKFGYTNMNKDELIDNAYRLIYKTIPFVLSNAEKYNGID